MTDAYKIESEVLGYSKQWVQDFNNKNVKGCVEAYTADAVMNARPMGTFKGISEIEGFWKPFIETGAADLEYTNVELAVENENTVLLRADWSMNIGKGVVIQERWVKQSDGKWQLEFDDFEVQEQY